MDCTDALTTALKIVNKIAKMTALLTGVSQLLTLFSLTGLVCVCVCVCVRYKLKEESIWTKAL